MIVHFGKKWQSLRSRIIMQHLGKSLLGIFEISNNYGTSWKINLLESPPPLNIPTPTPAPDRPPTQAMGPTRSGAGVGVGMVRGAGDALT